MPAPKVSVAFSLTAEEKERLDALIPEGVSRSAFIRFIVCRELNWQGQMVQALRAESQEWSHSGPGAFLREALQSLASRLEGSHNG